jgi:hypothetical protein
MGRQIELVFEAPARDMREAIKEVMSFDSGGKNSPRR